MLKESEKETMNGLNMMQMIYMNLMITPWSISIWACEGDEMIAVSPYGLPALAAWLVGKLEGMKYSLWDFILG